MLRTLSLVVSIFTVLVLPRTPEGVVYFDPVSIVWVFIDFILTFY